MDRSGKLHALLSTARVANIPSVVSNVWLGVFIGLVASSDTAPAAIPWPELVRLMLAGISLYVAGNFLNDWMDRSWDMANRPERALPRGLFNPGFYQLAAIAFGITGLALAASVNIAAAVVAAAIVVSVVIYTVWHKRGAWTVIPMGLCRALLPVMGFFGTYQAVVSSEGPSWVLLLFLTPCIALFCYITGLSLSARCESMDSPSKGTELLPRILLLLPVAFSLLPFVIAVKRWPLCIFGALVYLAWLHGCRKYHLRPVSSYVSALLAGIPLVDWIFLLPMALWRFPAAPPLPAEWFSLAIPPVAVVSALLLQRVAPAT